MYGSGRDPFHRSGVLRDNQRHADFQTELADLRDLLFNENEMARLIDDAAAIIAPPSDSASLAAADRAMWDFHPIMNSRYSMSRQAGQGRFYFQDQTASFDKMLDYMKQFVRTRSQWIDQRLLTDFQPLKRPELTLKKAGETIIVSVTNRENLALHFQWRIAEIRKQYLAQGVPGKYEIEGTIIPNLNTSRCVLPKHLEGTFRIRARSKDRNGRTSRWSQATEIVIEPARLAN